MSLCITVNLCSVGMKEKIVSFDYNHGLETDRILIHVNWIYVNNLWRISRGNLRIEYVEMLRIGRLKACGLKSQKNGLVVINHSMTFYAIYMLSSTCVTHVGPLKFVSAKYNGSLPSLVYRPYSWTKVTSASHPFHFRWATAILAKYMFLSLYLPEGSLLFLFTNLYPFHIFWRWNLTLTFFFVK